MTHRYPRLLMTWLPVTLVLLAAALRFWGLDTQGLWDDEGITYGRIALSWRSMLRALPAEQMPLYYIGLKAWIAAMGRSVLAMRAFSALPGVAMAPLAYSLGKRWWGDWAGAVAGLCLAVGPASIYQAQTMRGYPWLVLFTLGAVALAQSAPESSSWVRRAGYAILAAAALLTHLLAAPTLLALNLWVIATHRRERAVLAQWLPWQAAVVAPALAWVLLSGGSRGETLSTAGGNLPSLWEASKDLVSVAAVAPYDPTSWTHALIGLPFLAMALLGLGSAAWLSRRRDGIKPSAIYLVGSLWLAPFIFLYLLALLRDAPLYPYYWTALAPWAYLGAAAGVQAAARWRRWASLGIVVMLAGIMGWQLARYYQRTVENLAPLAQRIASQAGPSDAIVLSSVWRAECYKYYDRSGLALYAEPDREEIERITVQHARVWLLVFGRHPTAPITEGIIRQGFQVGRWTSGTTEMGLYLNETLPQEAQHPLRAAFGQEIELLGYEVQPDPVEAGAVAQVTLWWRAIDTPKAAYKVFVHAVGPDGQIGGQQDGEPGEGTRPTDSWAPGEVIADRHAVPITPGTMPGEHRITLGLYDGASGERLSVQSQDSEAKDGALTLRTIGVVASPKPDVSQLDIQHRLDLTMPDGLALAGYDLYKLGSERSNVRFKRGDFVHLVLYWLTPQAPLTTHTWLLEMVDRQGRIVSQVEGGAENQTAPGPAWPQDTLVTRQHDLAIPTDVGLDEYDLFFTLRDGGGAMVVSRQQLGPITVYPNVTPTPKP